MALTYTKYRWGCLLALAATLSACVNPLPSTADAFAKTARATQGRTGHQVFWLPDAPLDAEVQARIAALRQNTLSPDDAVQLALLNNRGLQATFERLAQVHADVTMATTPRNPLLTMLARFPIARGVLNGEINFLQEMLDIFTLPWRREQGTWSIEQERLQVAQAVMDTVLATRRAYTELQAAQHVERLRRGALKEVGEAAELEELRHRSRQVQDVNLALGRATFQQLKLDLARDILQVAARREALTELLGLEDGDPTWAVLPFPAIPEEEMNLDLLEPLALRQRFDVVGAGLQVAVLRRALHFTQDTALVGSVMVGAATSKDAEGTHVAGPTLLLELPVFNRRQALIESLASRVRQAERLHEQLLVSVRSQVRRARNAAVEARAVAEGYRTVLMPLRRRVTELTLAKVSDNQMGPWQGVLARDAELQTQRGWVDAQREYWLARAALEHATGGLP